MTLMEIYKNHTKIVWCSLSLSLSPLPLPLPWDLPFPLKTAGILLIPPYSNMHFPGIVLLLVLCERPFFREIFTNLFLIQFKECTTLDFPYKPFPYKQWAHPSSTGRRHMPWKKQFYFWKHNETLVSHPIFQWQNQPLLFHVICSG